MLTNKHYYDIVSSPTPVLVVSAYKGQKSTNALIAQLVEQLALNQTVGGSNPSGGTGFLYSRLYCVLV